MAMVPFTIPQMVVPSTIPQMVSDFSLHYTANIYRKWLLQMVSNGYTTNGYTANGFKWFPPLYRKWFQMVPSTIPQVVSNGYTANGFKWLYRKWLYRKWLYRKWFQMVPSTIPQMVSNGYTANGYTANGYTANGYTANGYTANGFKWFPPLYRKWFQISKNYCHQQSALRNTEMHFVEKVKDTFITTALANNVKKHASWQRFHLNFCHLIWTQTFDEKFNFYKQKCKEIFSVLHDFNEVSVDTKIRFSHLTLSVQNFVHMSVLVEFSLYKKYD